MSDGKGMSRRSFFKQSSTGVVAAAAAFPTIIPSRAFGAADRVNVAVIGIRGQGGGHIGGFPRVENTQIAAICDVDQNLFPDRVKAIQERDGNEPRTYTDMRRVFENPDIDAVTFAVPNHWHALGSIWAAQAGKHVYVEKPASHSVWEGRQMVNAARANNVLMQVGFQNRSRPNVNAAMRLLRSGGIGKVFMARGLCHKTRNNIGRYPDGPMPDGSAPFAFTTDARGSVGPYTRSYLDKVDYDMWTGPAPARPFNPNRFHYNWHWQWEYGNGDTGNQGPHQIDVGRWGLAKDDYPVKIASKGGMFIYTDSAQTTPNTQTTIFEYADGTIFEFSTRGLPTNPDGEIMIGDIFYGSEGRLEIDDGGNWKTYMGTRGTPGPDSSNIETETSDATITVGTGAGGHYGNFVAAIRSGKQSDLTCDIEEGHRSSALAHIGNIAYRLGRELKFDGATESFVNDAEANAMLKDTYRAPFVVPDLSGAVTTSR
jgi:predicted dehydrogenase